MFSKSFRKGFSIVAMILATLLLGGAATVASAFSVDVKKLYYADYDSSTLRREINYDFSAGTADGNIITIPAGVNGVVQVPTTEALTYTFGPYPDPENDIAVTLDTGTHKATLTTAADGGSMISATGTPNTSAVSRWVYAVTLTNFTGMTNAAMEYKTQIGFGSEAKGPHPELDASWVPAEGGGRSLVVRAAIYDDNLKTYTWGPFTAPVSGFNPATGVIVLRIRCLDPAAGGNTMVFDYSLDGETSWIPVQTLTFGFTAGNVPVNFPHMGLFDKVPFVSLQVQQAGAEDPFNVRSHHWKVFNGSGSYYDAWLTVDDPGQATYSAITVNSPDYLAGERDLAYNPAGGYWELPASLFSDSFTGAVVDGAKWTTQGSSVTQNGTLKVAQDAADAGGVAISRDIPINPYAPIVVQRRAYVHAAGSNYEGLLALYFGGDAGVNEQNATFSVIASHNRNFTGSGAIPADGFYLGRYPARSSSQTAATAAVWDNWFIEKIFYNPVSGVADLYINNELRATYNVGTLSAAANHLKVRLSGWSSGVGHYIDSDDLTVTQPWVGEPVRLSNDTPPASTVTFTFTATKKVGGTETVPKSITGYVEAFAENLLPAGNVSSTPTFSWTHVPGATSYAVQVYNANGNRIWNKYDIPSSTTSAVYNGNGAEPGPALEIGQAYSYDIVTSIFTNGSNNDSFAKGTFTFTTPPAPTLSFSGWVKNSPNWPATAGMLPAAGAQVSAFSPSTPSTPISTTMVDPATGAFTLTGIPQSSNFYIAVQPPEGYLTVLSKVMNWNANIQALLPFVLFTPTQYAAFGNTGGNGMILGRVALQSSPTTFLSGATIEAREWLNGAPTATTYPVTYNSVTGSTGVDGIYMVKNVPDGRVVQLTATLAGYTFGFNGAFVSVQNGFVSEESFFATPTPTISFSGFVMDSASTPNPVGGALIEQMGAMPPRTATSNTDGSYALAGLPAGAPFHLKASKDTYAPAYTGDMWSNGNIVNPVDQALNLFPTSQLSAWGIEAGKGIIRARVRDQARAPIGGVIISASSQLGQTYPICYDDGCTITSGNGGTTQATGSGAGRYVIKNVLQGDVVTVTATKPGWTFGSRSYHTYAGGVSQFGITGTGQGADEQAIRNGFVTAVAAINAGNLAGFMAFLSPSYLNDGENKAAFQANVNGLITAGGQLSHVIGSVSINGDLATVQVTLTITMGDRQEVNPETWFFRKENGTWLVYGNQQRHAVLVMSQHWADGYHAAFTVEDITRQATAVTVTGPGIAGALSLTAHTETWDGQTVNVWWSETQTPLIGTSIPATAPTYAITVTEPSGTTVYNRTITGWVQNFATNLSPSGQAGGPVVFTWAGIPEAVEYSVEMNDTNWNRIWNSDDIPKNRTWAIYGDTEDGPAPPLFQGNTYNYWIVSRDARDNASFTPGQFTYNGATGITFSGQVTAANGGAALSGVSVTLANNPNTTPATTSNAQGNITLSGVPAGSSFTVKMAMNGYWPTYTAIYNSTSSFSAGAPFGLYTAADTSAWPVNFTTKGAIATRVVDSAGGYIAGAVVTAQSMLHPDVPYSVTYRNDEGGFGGTATYGNGRFYVLGVDEGDIVTVTAAKRGYTFPSRKYMTKAGGISQGRITGTVGVHGGDVNHDGRLTLTDAILLLQVTAGIPPSAAIYLDADVNRDNMLDLAELLYVLQSVAGLR